MAISPSSAEAERGFSTLKLIKTRLRSRLSQNVLNDLLGIKMCSRSINDFDPTEAIHQWNKSGERSRRPIFKDREPGTSSSAHQYTQSECQDNGTDEDSPASSYDDTQDGDTEYDFDEALTESEVFHQLNILFTDADIASD